MKLSIGVPRGRNQLQSNNSIKTTGSIRKPRSRSRDDNFTIQHNNMMSQQQFKTKTTRSLTSRQSDAGSIVSLSSRKDRSINASSSHETGYMSHLSRSTSHTGFDEVPNLIEKPNCFRGSEEITSKVRNIIEDLNKSIQPQRRIAAITNACAEFDHWDTETHNIELKLGCSNVLCFVLSMTENEDEIRMICAALEMVFRASTESVRMNYHEVGPSILPLLIKIIEKCENSKFSNSEISILNISKVLLYFSRVQELRKPLVDYNGMLGTLTRVSSSLLSQEARVLRMRIIANLCNWEENKFKMSTHPGFLDSVLKVAATDSSPTAREYAAASLMDLASSSESQESMANHDRLLATLVKLVVADETDGAREYAVTAIQNLAFSKRNRVRLVQFSDGVIIEALKKALSSDNNDKSRRRAAGAITNLACEETAQLMEGHTGLLDVIAKAAIYDVNDDVQKRSCLALSKITSSSPIDSKYFQISMTALVRASLGKNSTGIPAVFRLKARDALRRQEMARIPGLLDALADIYFSKFYNMKDKDNAIRAIMHLTNDTENRKAMCNKTILKSLVAAADENDQKEIRDSAVISIERLATEITNRKYMARHPNLLSVIAKATERESASELNGEKSSQPRLAKQLLMSLLLAM
jgi:hypothetical protein